MDDQTIDFRLGNHNNSNSPFNDDQSYESLIQELVQDAEQKGFIGLPWAKLEAEDLMVLVQEYLFDLDHKLNLDGKYEKHSMNTEQFNELQVRILLNTNVEDKSCDWVSQILESTIERWFQMHDDDLINAYKKYQEAL